MFFRILDWIFWRKWAHHSSLLLKSLGSFKRIFSRVHTKRIFRLVEIAYSLRLTAFLVLCRFFWLLKFQGLHWTYSLPCKLHVGFSRDSQGWFFHAKRPWYEIFIRSKLWNIVCIVTLERRDWSAKLLIVTPFLLYDLNNLDWRHTLVNMSLFFTLVFISPFIPNDLKIMFHFCIVL